VHGALNVWRSCSKQDDAHSPPCTPPTCWPSSEEEEEEEPDAGQTKKTVTTGAVDDEEWADDTYGCMPWGSDSDEYDNVSHTASSTVVRLPRSLLAPFASALMDELDKLGVECARERLAEAHKKAKRADDEIQSLHDVSARLGDSVTSLRSGNLCRIKAIKELKGVQERLEADIKRLNVKTADAYATLIVAREDAAKAGNEMTVGMSLMRAESTALQSEVVAIVARKASHAAALQLARSEADALEDELRSAKEVADGRKCVARAALRDLEADRAASAADLDRAHALTQAAVLQAVDARVVHMDALDEAMRLREEAERAREEGERLREEAVALDKQNALLLEDSGLLKADVERLEGETGPLRADVERLQGDVESLARRRNALQAQSTDTCTRIDELLQERHRHALACGKVMGEVEELTVRHRVAVRARLGAGAACRAAAAQANAAMREIASLESLATANRHRAAAARDAAVEAESASFRAKVQRDLTSSPS
jgi:chromosome segregation ATPase